MFAELVAVPPADPHALVRGARYELSAEPLRIGRTEKCILRLDVSLGHELLVGLVRGVPTVWAERGAPVQCSLSGRPIETEHPRPLVDGDHLVFATGLVVALRERPTVTARSEALERAVSERPEDPEALAVYVDFLREHGDPLADWLTRGRHQVEPEQFFALGPLSESARTQAVHATFSSLGLVTSLRLARHALVGRPGLFWHLALLGTVPVLRTVGRLDVDFVVEAPAKHVVAPAGVLDWPREPSFELVTRHVLELLERGGPRTPRSFCLGFAAEPPVIDDATHALVRRALPSWNGAPLVRKRGW